MERLIHIKWKKKNEEGDIKGERNKTFFFIYIWTTYEGRMRKEHKKMGKIKQKHEKEN